MPALTVPAIASQNTLLYLGTDVSPSVFSTNVARMGDITITNETTVVDVTNQESGSRRRLATLIGNGPMSGNLFWEPTSVQDEALLALKNEKPPVLRSWKIVWPDGQAWLFAAYLTKMSPASKIGDALRAAFELTIDGDVLVVG